MLPETARIEDYPELKLSRNIGNMSIHSADIESFQTAKRMKGIKLQERNELSTMKHDICTLKEEISEVRDVLNKVYSLLEGRAYDH